MFASSLESIGTWRASRLPAGRFLLLAALFAYAAWLSSTLSASRLAITLAAMFSLIAQFRLWDDLIDRVHDQAGHPERVLARVSSTMPFVRAVVALGFLNSLVVTSLGGVPAASALAALYVLLAIWYRHHPRRDLLHTHVLLAKYPWFVLILAMPIADPKVAIVAIVSGYCAMCLYELLDHDGPLTHVTKPIYAAHVGALAAAPSIVVPSLDAALAGGISVCALCWCACNRSLAVPRAVRQAVPFIACALVLAVLSLRRFS